MLYSCRLRTLVKFDNEMRVFSQDVHNYLKFDLFVFDKGGHTERFDAAFFTRERPTQLSRPSGITPGSLRLEFD